MSETLGEWRSLWRDSIGLRRVDGGSPVAASVAGKAIRKALMDFDHPATPGQGDHRIGGYYAVSAQGEFPCAPTSQVPDLPGTPDAVAFGLPILLARMDYDPDAGMPWGDCGTSEWTIGREDLAAHRFDRVEFSWSCY
ncbi:DUF1963 domain-containing protein [Glycomyces niveus]|uniref:DUF1963 domain-containing protein n=1 Tax=Glycomyces niveus TaxID=2820287 RepID=A0ABS3UCA5_9ACTN|nr:DUF1963 domain-containing protein [Glycomyces sp. NEAU-S30]MBO3735856.1 DUF1963 domain-containing protein [Glycomyces sp. NEAU-S30]